MKSHTSDAQVSPTFLLLILHFLLLKVHSLLYLIIRYTYKKYTLSKCQ